MVGKRNTATMRRVQQLLPLNTGPQINPWDLEKHEHSTDANPLIDTKLPPELVELVNSNLTLRALATDEVIAQFEIELMQQIGVWDSLKAIVEKKESERTEEDLTGFVRVLGSCTHDQEVDHSFEIDNLLCTVTATLGVYVMLNDGKMVNNFPGDINNIDYIHVEMARIKVTIHNKKAGMGSMHIGADVSLASVFVDSPHFAIKKYLSPKTYEEFVNNPDNPAGASLGLKFNF